MSDKDPKQQLRGGQILKEAREAQGISLETVHLATKIPLDALKSIEEGYKVRTLTPFYVKGFMKMYAQYLNVDVTKVLEDYRPEQLPPHIPDAGDQNSIADVIVGIPKKRQKIIAEVVGGIIFLLLVIKVASVVWMAQTHKKPAKVAVGKAEKKAARPLRRQTTNTSIPTKTASVPSVREQKLDPPKTITAEKPAAVVKAPAVDEEKPAVAAKKVRLTIRAKKSGWLQVKVDGSIAFQSTLEEGASESWEAKKEIELSGKNIHNLEFELNGRVLGGLGREDRSARRVVVTAQGLSVKSTL